MNPLYSIFLPKVTKPNAFSDLVMYANQVVMLFIDRRSAKSTHFRHDPSVVYTISNVIIGKQEEIRSATSLIKLLAIVLHSPLFVHATQRVHTTWPLHRQHLDSRVYFVNSYLLHAFRVPVLRSSVVEVYKLTAPSICSSSGSASRVLRSAASRIPPIANSFSTTLSLTILP